MVIQMESSLFLSYIVCDKLRDHYGNYWFYSDFQAHIYGGIYIHSLLT